MLRMAYKWLAISMLLGACASTDALTNPGFDVWCDGHPCGWETSGDVEQVGSWHKDDYAISLISDDASLSQFNRGRNSTYSSCFAFSLVAKIDRRAEVYLELDFLDDGVTDFSQRIPASDWERRTFNISGPSWYEGLRFIIRKASPGQAIVAELRARSLASGCASPPIELNDRPENARCERDDQCSDGSCKWGGCTRCRFDADCDPQKVCALMVSDGKMFSDCAPRGSSPFGSPCAASSQCASGFCVDRSCSECRSDADCPRAGKCRPSPATPPQNAAHWPLQCDPGRRLRTPGEACVDRTDCMSNVCRDSAVSCLVGGCAESSADDDAGSCSEDCSSWQVAAGTCD